MCPSSCPHEMGPLARHHFVVVHSHCRLPHPRLGHLAFTGVAVTTGPVESGFQNKDATSAASAVLLGYGCEDSASSSAAASAISPSVQQLCDLQVLQFKCRLQRCSVGAAAALFRKMKAPITRRAQVWNVPAADLKCARCEVYKSSARRSSAGHQVGIRNAKLVAARFFQFEYLPPVRFILAFGTNWRTTTVAYEGACVRYARHAYSYS